MKSVAKKRVTNKKSTEKPVSEGIRRAAKRAGIERKPKGDDAITLRRGTIELLVSMLEGAKHSAIEGAIPPRFADAGPVHAIEAYRAIRFVQRDLRRALEGGAS